MAYAPNTAQVRLPQQQRLMAALTSQDWKHRAYIFQWAIEHLEPQQLARYYQMVRRHRPHYHIRVRRIVDRMAFVLNEYRAGRKRWRTPTIKRNLQQRVGNWAQTLSGGTSSCSCGCGDASECGGMGFAGQDALNAAYSLQSTAKQQKTSQQKGSTFDYTNPMHWIQVINGGVGVVGKVACMIDPNLAYCKGQTTTPPNFDVLCAQPQAATTPACQQYLMMKRQGALTAAQQQYNLQQQSQKKDHTPLLIAASVGLGILLLGSSQPARR